MQDLKHRTIRGGLAKICSQVANLTLRMGSLMILARLLDPKDFGLVGMVTSVVGVFSVFKDFGLSAAAVQRTTVSEEQSSTLFWINLLVGATLSLIVLALAPLVVVFYHEHRLYGVTAVLASAFLFNAAGVQHTALLERQMRFTTLSIIELLSLLVSTGVGIAMATHGFGYWSLVATTTITPLVYSICVWFVTRWVPGRPHRNVEIRSMMRFGGALTLNGFVMYIASNLEKVLLGKFWGVEALGIYGRAYQLISIPSENLNSATAGVAFAALSRIKGDHDRLKNYFLKGYSLVLSATVPITLTCALFAEDIIHVFLGAKWKAAVVVFRLLAPTTLALAILNPLSWLLSSLGLVARVLKIAFVLAPAMVIGYVIGLPYGPKGVAFSYSTVMVLSVAPLIVWVTRGTVISVMDILRVVARPLFSGIIAASVAYALQLMYGPILFALPRLVFGLIVFSSVYVGMLLFVLGQKSFYLDLIRSLQKPAPNEEQYMASQSADSIASVPEGV